MLCTYITQTPYQSKFHAFQRLESAPASHYSPCSVSKSSKASVKVAVVASQKSIRSSQPLRSASNADVPLSSVVINQEADHHKWEASSSSHTPGLDTEMHFRLGWVRDGVAAKFDIRTVFRTGEKGGERERETSQRKE